MLVDMPEIRARSESSPFGGASTHTQIGTVATVLKAYTSQGSLGECLPISTSARRGNHHELRTEDRGTWLLDLGWFASWRTRALLGERVVVTGSRAGFNIPDVWTLKPLQ